MGIPTSVRLGPFNFEVTEKPLEDRFGNIEYSDLRIDIDTAQAEDCKREALLHEILHGLFFVADLKDDSLEEDIVRRLSPLLLAAMRDNRSFFEEILNEDR